jgi:hypothetical protein
MYACMMNVRMYVCMYDYLYLMCMYLNVYMSVCMQRRLTIRQTKHIRRNNMR